MRATHLLSTVVLAAITFVATARADRAIVKDKPNPAFAGRIMLSDKRFPTQAASLAAFNAKVKGQSKTNFYEDKEKKGWKIQVAGFLKAPLNDVEYVVKIFELGRGPAQLLATIEQYTDSRGQLSLITNIELDKKTVGVNKELQITMESKGRTLAVGRFKILGEGEKFNGKVNFSADDANGKSNDDE